MPFKIFLSAIDECKFCVVHLISKQAPFEGAAVNVANGREVSINELVRLFIQLTDWRGRIQFNDLEREGDPTNWQADITRISSYGYVPLVPLEAGLTRYNK